MAVASFRNNKDLRAVFTLLTQSMPAHHLGIKTSGQNVLCSSDDACASSGNKDLRAVFTLLIEMTPARHPVSRLGDLNPGPTHYECVRALLMRVHFSRNAGFLVMLSQS
jgi:hypothetical protein